MRFRTTFRLTLLLFALAAVFARLGAWQLERMEQKQELFTRFDSAPEMALADAIANAAQVLTFSAYGQMLAVHAVAGGAVATQYSIASSNHSGRAVNPYSRSPIATSSNRTAPPRSRKSRISP